MSLTAAAIRLLASKGLSAEDIADVADAMAPEKAARSPGAERTRRWREKKEQSVTSDVTVTRHEVTETRPLPSFPPVPPKQPTPTRESISTREERLREEAGWDVFWNAYPRKVGKADARKAFTKAWRKLPPFDEDGILRGGLERAKAAWVDAQFIPHAATWLNGERWQDEPEPPPAVKPNGQRPHSRPTRQTDFVERLGDIDAAMAAAFEQPRSGH